MLHSPFCVGEIHLRKSEILTLHPKPYTLNHAPSCKWDDLAKVWAHEVGEMNAETPISLNWGIFLALY